jgi:CYTH domain-containing protein
MPTENELKYLLQADSENKFRKSTCLSGIRHIRQGYLGFSKGMSLRIRETNDERYELTFKQKVNNRVVEIEKKINARDFEDLWSVSVNRLEKIRYDMRFLDKNSQVHMWEVDAFKDHDHNTYMMLAEHEMPEGVEEPNYIPSLIRETLVYAVPRIDDRFASKKIADVKYAKKLYGNCVEKVDLIESP